VLVAVRDRRRCLRVQRFIGTDVTVPMLTEPTSAQRQAFRLIGVPIPLTLK
jgi:hypothetical protein